MIRSSMTLTERQTVYSRWPDVSANLKYYFDIISGLSKFRPFS